LILNHISARYHGNLENALLHEAQAIFSPTYVAHDHFSFSVVR
jgi:ribonuclease BN (tRNA processing enzyme)